MTAPADNTTSNLSHQA